MPTPLRRSPHRELTLTRSFVNVLRSKVYSVDSSEFDVRASNNTRLTSQARHPCRKVHFICLLPNEILAHVFILGSEDDVMLPVAVSHVCSAWRELALRTPSLWRRISLSSPEDMWKERICRAMSCSLDIELLPYILGRFGFPRPQRLDLHTVQWYMHIVTPFITRWGSLKIVFSDYSPFLWNAALSGCCGRRIYAPLIKDITLIFPSNDDTKYFTLFGGVAPNLRRLRLDGLRLTWLPSLFANLTTLDYTHHGFTQGNQAVYEVLSMLQVSNHLVELRLSFPWKGNVVSGPVQANRSISLPMLASLYLRIDSHDIPIELSRLMANTATPALSSLYLLDLRRSSHPFPHLYLFLKAFRMPSSLRSLHIENGWFDPGIVVPPNLHRYVVRRSHLPDQIVEGTAPEKLQNTPGT